jgi:hypothetical protein
MKIEPKVFWTISIIFIALALIFSLLDVIALFMNPALMAAGWLSIIVFLVLLATLLLFLMKKKAGFYLGIIIAIIGILASIALAATSGSEEWAIIGLVINLIICLVTLLLVWKSKPMFPIEGESHRRRGHRK